MHISVVHTNMSIRHIWCIIASICDTKLKLKYLVGDAARCRWVCDALNSLNSPSDTSTNSSSFIIKIFNCPRAYIAETAARLCAAIVTEFTIIVNSNWRLSKISFAGLSLTVSDVYQFRVEWTRQRNDGNITDMQINWCEYGDHAADDTLHEDYAKAGHKSTDSGIPQHHFAVIHSLDHLLIGTHMV